MLEPKLVQIPDYSSYLGKEFIFEEDFKHTGSRAMFCKGMRFKITKIKNTKLTIKLTSTIEECSAAIEDFASSLVKDQKKELAIFDKIIKIWEEEADQFEIDKGSPWNKPDYSNDNRGGHCINTSYPVPKDHPDKYGMAKGTEDTIMTFDYKHKGGKKNIYSYQQGRNEWYSKACYEFFRLNILEDIKKHETLNQATRKDIYKTYLSTGWLSKYEITAQTLNKGKFKLLK